MIETRYLTAWKQIAPWPSMAQVEQDLIISRVLVELYNHPVIKENLAFCGGTALNKLFLKPAARYSEDLDFVQCNSDNIGPTISAIREILSKWLGTAKKYYPTKRSYKLIYVYKSVEGTPARLKIEINTTENYHCNDYLECLFLVNNAWFSGSTIIKTYQLDELMGSKMRALFQRIKGRDLFDLWYVPKVLTLNQEKIVNVFLEYMKNEGQKITRKMYERSLYQKASNSSFSYDVNPLIRPGTIWDFDEAFNTVLETFISLLPGAPWKGGDR